MDQWVGLFERQVLAQELQAGVIDRMASLQARRDLRAEGGSGSGSGAGDEDGEQNGKEEENKGKEKETQEE